jgi:hypothetical protein
LLIGPRSYEVAVDRRSNGERIVHVNGLAVPVSIIESAGTPVAHARRASLRDGAARDRVPDARAHRQGAGEDGR